MVALFLRYAIMICNVIRTIEDIAGMIALKLVMPLHTMYDSMLNASHSGLIIQDSLANTAAS